MIQIHDITNTIFTSKTYILYKEGEDKAWMVDIGDIEPVLEYLKAKKLLVEGIFLTHAHFDHIYGIKSLMFFFPDCKIYATAYAKEGLASDKLNLSRYHETPITYDGDNVVEVKEGDSLALFEDEPSMMFYETPGHNPGCLTMVIGDVIFTGDAYIPGVGVNTQPPKANKEQARQSLERIMKLTEGRTILSGHYIK